MKALLTCAALLAITITTGCATVGEFGSETVNGSTVEFTPPARATNPQVIVEPTSDSVFVAYDYAPVLFPAGRVYLDMSEEPYQLMYEIPEGASVQDVTVAEDGTVTTTVPE